MTRRAGGSAFDALTDDAAASLLFDNPKAGMRTIARVAKEEAVQAMEQQRLASQFWNSFFRSNPDLKGHVAEVEHVMRSIPGLFDMAYNQATRELADTSRRYVEEKARQAPAARDAGVYSAGPYDEMDDGQSWSSVAPKPTQTLSDTIRARKEARRAVWARRGRKVA